MSGPQFTPGPWRNHDMERFTIVAGHPGIFVALLDARDRTEEEKHANCRLVIAAPALFEACEAALNFLMDGTPDNAISPLEASTRAQILAALAIAKAEGGG